MKRSIIIILLALFGAASCGKEDIPSDNGLVRIVLSAGMSSDYTRAAADETVVADRCILEIFNEDGTRYYDDGRRLVVRADASGRFNFEPMLMAGRSYRFVFWADKSGATADDDLYYSTANGLRNITLAGDVPACDLSLDAYYGTETVVADHSQTVSATLKRAVCRINVSTGYRPAQPGDRTVAVTFSNAPARFDAMTGEIDGEMACSTSATVSVPAAGDEVEWYMYMFAPADAGLRTVDFDMAVTSESGGMSEFEYSFSGIPLVRNHRVNVTIGSASGAGMSLRME